MSLRPKSKNTGERQTKSNRHANLDTSSPLQTRKQQYLSLEQEEVVAFSTISTPMERLKLVQKRSKCVEAFKFLQDFRIIVCSPLFLRHRNVLVFFLEIVMPALAAGLVLAVFTASGAWKEAISYRKSASSRTLTIPERSMFDAVQEFRAVHTDRWNRANIYFSPNTDFTSKVMENAVKILGIEETPLLLSNGDIASGAIGFNDTKEMIERAVYRNTLTASHGIPVVVIFKYNETLVSNLTQVPYYVNYTIRTFDEDTSKTEELHPFVPKVNDGTWESPYLKNGFVGLQYAIDEAIIRIILERQRKHEMKDIERSAASRARALSLEEAPDYLTSEDIDIENLKFLVEDTLRDIEREKNRRADLDYSGLEYPDESPQENAFARSLSQKNEKLLGKSATFRTLASSTELPTRSLQAIKFDQTLTPAIRQSLSHAVIFSFVIAYCFMGVFTVNQIAKERSSGTKELLQIHGLPHYMYWVLLFFHALLFRAITSALVMVALILNYGNGAVVSHTRLDIMFVVIYAHQLALTFLNYFVASFNASARFGYMCAVTTCILTFYAPTFGDNKEFLPIWELILSIVFPNWSFRWIISYVLEYEAKEEVLSWQRMWKHKPQPESATDAPRNYINVGENLIKMVCAGLVYYVLAVNTGIASGHPLLLTVPKWRNAIARIGKKRSTNKNKQKTVTKHADHVIIEKISKKPAVYEDPHPDRPCFVKIRNLSKNYGLQKLSLDSINIDIVHEEVTVIMGHSGSGKSTLMSILSGMIHPSHGEAIVCGYNTSTETSKARKFIGVCPQKLISFSLLTIREHVHLCYKLRGYSTKHCNEYTSNILTELRLWNVRRLLPSKLTKDQMQRLGLALCLVDAPKVLLLDEITRGMDSMGRREIWDIILAMRHNHTIIVTTNYMEEAEHLADHLALLAHGRLVCYGSLDYLKAQYDTGFFLKIIPFENAFLDSNAAINFVRSHLGSDVKIKKHRRIKDVDTLELELPSKEKDKFADFCDELDMKKSYLHILSYSIRQVNLNDIFIKICSSVSADSNAVDFYVRRDSAGDIKTVLQSEIPEIPHEKWNKVSKTRHFKTLFRRVLTIGRTSRSALFMYLLLPLFMIYSIVGYAGEVVARKYGEHPELALISKTFGPEQRVLTHIVEDDPIANYSTHMSRVLGAHEERIGKQDFVTLRMYDKLDFANESELSGFVQDDYMVALELGKRSNGEVIMRGAYTSGNFHSAPLAVNLMDNSILSAISEAERGHVPNWHEYRVNVLTQPMPVVQPQDHDFELICDLTCVLLATMMSLAIGSLSYTSILLLTKEMETGIRHLIMMCGVDPLIYWSSYILMHCGVLALVTIIILIIFLADFEDVFNHPQVLLSGWLISALYLLWSGTCYACYVAYRTAQRMNAFTLLNLIHFLSGCVLFLFLNSIAKNYEIALIFKNLLIIINPPFTLSHALLVFLRLTEKRNICNGMPPFIQDICKDSADADYHTHQPMRSTLLNVSLDNLGPEYYKCCPRKCKGLRDNTPNMCFEVPEFFNVADEKWSNMGMITIVSIFLLQGVLFFLLVLVSERKKGERALQSCLHSCFHSKSKVGDVERGEGNADKPDVARENQAVKDLVKKMSTHWPNNLCVLCEGLTKSSGSKMLLKDFNLVARKGQCIAILGRGNSGKSAIANMIAGAQVPTKGNCYMKDSNLLNKREQYLSHIGYAPQKGSFYDMISSTEMLELFGRLRGIPNNMLNTHVTKWLSVMGLDDVASFRIADLGDGLRQRLSISMALIGSADLIVLDEPTTGVEPAARERLWCVLEQLTNRGYTIILTTCSTDEAFSLAHKMLIVTDGIVQCVGKPDEIQNKYARGHTITFQLKHDLLAMGATAYQTEQQLANFKHAVTRVYKQVDLLDEHDELLMFFLRDSQLTWAEAYRRGHHLTLAHSEIIASFELTEGGVDDIFVFLSNKYNELEPPKDTQKRVKRSFAENSFVANEPTEEDDMKQIKNLQATYRRRTSFY